MVSLALLVVALAAPSAAVIRLVEETSDGHCPLATLRCAVHMSESGDVVALQGGKVYTLSYPDTDCFTLSRATPSALQICKKGLVIRSTTPSYPATIRIGSGSDDDDDASGGAHAMRVLWVGDEAALTLQDVAIANGRVPNEKGGGVKVRARRAASPPRGVGRWSSKFARPRAFSSPSSPSAATTRPHTRRSSSTTATTRPHTVVECRHHPAAHTPCALRRPPPRPAHPRPPPSLLRGPRPRGARVLPQLDDGATGTFVRTHLVGNEANEGGGLYIGEVGSSRDVAQKDPTASPRRCNGRARSIHRRDVTVVGALYLHRRAGSIYPSASSRTRS